MRAVVFDLDGTLIDSAPDIHAAVNRALTGVGAEALSLAEVTSFIGNGIPTLVERVMRARDLPATDHPELLKRFSGHYDAAPATLTRPYAGVMDLLAGWSAAGVPMAICTNKPEAPARAILNIMGMAAHFPVVVGGDTLPVRKPDPAPLHYAVEALGAHRVLYVGDSETDAETARRAGLPFALFTEGYRKAPVAELPHDMAFTDFADLPGILDRLLPAAA